MPDSPKSDALYIEVDRETRLGLVELAKAKGGLNPLQLAAELLRDKVHADARALQPTRH